MPTKYWQYSGYLLLHCISNPIFGIDRFVNLGHIGFLNGINWTDAIQFSWIMSLIVSLSSERIFIWFHYLYEPNFVSAYYIFRHFLLNEKSIYIRQITYKT